MTKLKTQIGTVVIVTVVTVAVVTVVIVKYLSKTNWTPQQPIDVLRAAFRDSCDVLYAYKYQ